MGGKRSGMEGGGKGWKHGEEMKVRTRSQRTFEFCGIWLWDGLGDDGTSALRLGIGDPAKVFDPGAFALAFRGSSGAFATDEEENLF